MVSVLKVSVPEYEFDERRSRVVRRDLQVLSQELE